MEFAWNAQKNKMSDIKGKENEQERKGLIRNKDIDLSKTHLNYDLVESNFNLYQRIKKRVEEVRENSRIQKNSVVDVSNIITLNKEQFEEWGEDKSKGYFREVYNYFCNEFGEENVVSAKVHMDETTPHMHLHFVPIKDGKLQCRSVLNQSRFNKVHTNVPKYLQEKGFNVVRGNGKTKERGNIDNIHEYKKEIENILSNELKNLKIDLEAHRGALNEILDLEHLEYKKTLLTGEIKLKNDIFDSIVNSIKNLTIENNDLKENLKSKDKKIEKIENELKSMDFKLTEKEYLISKLNKRKRDVKEELRKEYEEQLNEHMNDWFKVKELQREIFKIEVENKEIKKDLVRYRNLYEQQEKIINSNPELKKLYLKSIPVEKENKNKKYSMSL
ncbi:MobV family relaxase [Clostridium perfringens]|uniref:MobV family relaxase n=4 Tax=Clostridium perfringens TaxID=1502 RepID=UPI0001666D99|nr:MobV family relaxase [Clostridium perfringens]EDS79413.1 putative recombination protein [Clostridium perfringens C str. JGS1495]MDV5113569.1 MobV family relaxase [Clostridium perfringens]NGT47341.1 recombinase [Clostridium perfringens]NGT77416.1 recombinase [Clostridium perfringens]PWX16278.1 recombinase [Clostridium perfringens]